MIRKYRLILICLVCFGAAHAQVFYPPVQMDTLNKYDSLKNKTGWWLELVTRKLKVTNDPKEAVFYGFAYYQKGKKIYSPAQGTGGEVSVQGRKDTISMADGRYLKISKKGILEEEDFFEKGRLRYSKNYQRNGMILEDVDYTKSYNNIPFSFLYTLYNEKGVVVQEVYMLCEGGKSKIHWIIGEPPK